MAGHPVDYIIIVGYLIFIAAFGIISGGKQKSVDDYFLGSKSVPWWAVCFSIVAAETSTLTFISIPGLAYSANLNFLQVTIGYLLGRIVVAFIFLPAYQKGELKTAYSYLENRFGAKTRSFASIIFLFTRTAADGVRLFATAIPLKLMLNISYPLAIIIIAIVTLVYTYTGGVKGVIWVDVVQMFIYLGGAIIAAIFLLNIIPGGWNGIYSIAETEHKFSIINLGMDKGISDFFSQPYTLIGGLIGGAFLSMASHGTDQLIVQRLLTTKTLKDSQKAIIGSGVIVIIQFTIFLIVGVMLYAYYGKINAKPDEIFPKFIIEVLPPGVTGIIIAGLFAAAMSTLAGSMSSLSSSTMIDLFIPLKNKISSNLNAQRSIVNKNELKISRMITILWAALLVLAALFFMNTSQAVVELALSIASFTYGGLLGTFLLGILLKKTKQKEALAGFTIGIVTMIIVISLKIIAWTWYTLVGVSATIIAGFLIGVFLEKKN
ncbi:sodium:solute symporter [Melioribacteraceae bacterium 4301-Me]|uniref:sodium:solute symporter n=1 Tax=Pyranulibacter aquaticus TaxID=3163344 RepID=UPI00359BE0F7